MPSGEPETSELKYKRVLLKLSGEALMGPGQFGIDIPTCEKFAKAIKEAREAGAEVCLVIGGGNIFRGVAGAAKGMDRAQADSMGMLATVMNALAMQSVLENMDVPTRVLSAIHMEAICEPYIRRRAQRHMEKGTQVDGVYTADPKLDATATRYDDVSYQELLVKDLRVMDSSAVSLMRDNNIPIVVFSLKEEGSLLKVLHGQGTSTTIANKGASSK